ncbi:MAG TPA: hypothetical protein VIJ96_12245 [Acidothermaceae bacterium]
MLSDDDLRSLSRQELDDLRSRLAHAGGDMPSLTAGNQRRRRFVVIMTVATLGLIPWVIVLALTLPKHYIAGHWTLTWVGFDLGLLTSLGLTAYLAWRRRQAVIGVAFLSAAMLTCDAWFDITTSSGPVDVATSIASAALVELPLATMLFAVAHQLLSAATDQARRSHLGLTRPARSFKTPLFGVSEQPPSPAAS